MVYHPPIGSSETLYICERKKQISQADDQKQTEFIKAWTTAAKELWLEIKPWFRILDDNGQTVHCTLLIENFGGPIGTAIFTDIHQSPDPAFSLKGLYDSTLGDSYAEYQRDLFADTLNDWGYFGDQELKPDWYNGQFLGQNN